MKRLITICLILNTIIFSACSSKSGRQEWYDNQSFIKALQLSNYPAVSGYIYTSNINLKSKDKDGDTPLTIAVNSTSDAKLIQTLIDAGIDAAAVNDEGYTALLLAAKNNINPNISKAIIMTGVDIEQADPAGRTPLILAAANNKNKNVALLFLEAGAQGRTSQNFRSAVENNRHFNRQDKDLLLSGKLENTVKIPWYNSKDFENALASGDMRQLAQIAAKTDLSAKNPDTQKDASSLLDNIKNPQMLYIFVRNGINLNTQDEQGKTLLYKAAEQGDTQRLKELLKVKADPNVRAKDASTPLMAAALNHPENEENIKLLIASGADINAPYNKAGSTLLFKLIEENKDIKLIELLIKSGADVNKKNAARNTPLIIAAKNAKDEKIIELLLNNKANIDAKNGQGFTALLTAATSNTNPDITVALMKKTKNKLDTGHVLDFSAQNPNPEVNNAVIKYLNADLDARKNPEDKTDPSIWFNNKAFVSAIKKGNTDIIKRELQKDLNLDALMQGQFNALMLAAAFSKTAQPINLLIDAGADVNSTNNNGDTPLMTAVLTNKNLPAIQALVQAGADVNAVDKNGTNIIMAAANKNPNEKIPVFLLQSGATVQNTKALLKYAQGNSNKKVYELLKKLFTKPASQSKNS